jgi:uncharacterized damage-inducible protein DinB
VFAREQDARMAVAASTLRAKLDEGRARLFAQIRGLTEEQFRHTPQDEAWPIAAYLAHLLRIERVYAERAAAALHQDEPSVASTRVHNDDDPGLAQRMAVPQVIHGMLNARRDLLAVLERCDGAALERVAVHETLGRMTVGEMMAKMAGHEDEHASDVARLVKLAPASARVILPLMRRS